MQHESADERGKTYEKERDAGSEQLVAPVQDEGVANREGEECEGSVPEQACDSSRLD